MPGRPHKNTQQDRLERKGELLAILDNAEYLARQMAEDIPAPDSVPQNVLVKDGWSSLAQELEVLINKAKHFSV